MALITREQVAAAYAALATLDRPRMLEMWHEDMRWLVPGHNPLSGWKNNVDEFMGFMSAVGRLSDNSFRMDTVVVNLTDDSSADVTRNTGHRAGDLNRQLDIDVIHWMRWRDGKVYEARGAIFGDGTAQYDAFWS
ncbi:nuclear transport factor 2 family protein [Defluviicoccus vanus]|uniref:Nuclear transport factor 2 family protein n=1 Tax=Defluviicoccus vanus TaxID=111831 RepID=A0A7H1MYL2_9PROT|nr:nuclear transport factor 2 family protein [Defluviicoccus vanus]QNT68548.1 nuclear transport factor 2 family protein [Defluviicoccus vanus]